MYSGFLCKKSKGSIREYMENYIEVLKRKLEDAEMVLVGIGEDFDSTEKQILTSETYRKWEARIPEEKQWMLPFVYRKTAEEHNCEQAYVNLGKLLEKKNYFIVSLKTDDLIYKEKFALKADRIVTPCGGTRMLQCEENCSKKVYDIPAELSEQLEKSWNGGGSFASIDNVKCPECGKNLVFNRVGEAAYCEEGYLPMWGKYMKWLQGTLNRRLCILELGVGLKYPSVIRWPFEKTAFFNQKACLFRVHHKLYQLTEELNGKGYAVGEEPADFLANSFE